MGEGLTRGPLPHLAYLLLTSLLMLGGLHGATSMWVLLLLGCSFLVSRVAAGRAYGPLLLWSWHLGALVAVRGTQGFRGLHPGLTWMQQQGGPLRWHIHYNLLLLRMLSYGMDLHWAVRSASAPAAAPDTPATAAAAMPASTPPAPSTAAAAAAAAAAAPHTPLRAPLVASAAAPGSGGGVGGVRRRHPVPPPPGADPSAMALQAKVRVEAPRPLGQYSLVLYCVYCLYPPLYIAGPIMTHNDFVAQLQGPGPSRPSWRQVLVYSLRWCGALAALELLTRCLLVNAVAKYGLLTSRLDLLRGWLSGGVSPLHFALVGFWVLVFMWLKFLVIWRFFHCLALLEGVEPPENMGRCVCNNYDIEGFWRGWHCSYNRWLVRYLYIPLGGATRRLLVIWPVFLFVALWHDLEPRLLHWGLLMPAAFCPELVVKAAAKLPLLARHRQRWWYRQVAALLASCNILALMTANLAGFVVGVEGVGPLVRQVLGQPAMAGGVLGTLFCAVQLMFAIRQREDAEKHGRVATA
ncbi:MBOAT, membrane-bound O-acyltransferase family-domain-containing protein [Haematococcus lacustris]